MALAPRQVNDGNWKIPSQHGCDVKTLPFSDHGDQVSAEIKRVMRVDHRYYKPLKPMDSITVDGQRLYLVHEGETSQVGNGIVEWTRTFASVPAPRFEYGQIGYTRQEWTGSDISEFTELQTCLITYEYSLAPLPILFAPKIIRIGSEFSIIGNWGRFVTGQRVLAEDSENGRYKSQIYFRKQVEIHWKAITDYA